MQCYARVINRINGQKLCNDTALPDILPPQFIEVASRPKKKRRLQVNETRPTNRVRRSTPMRCTRCGVLGHSKRSCEADDATVTAAQEID